MPMLNLSCINDAAVSYHVPARLILAVLEAEHSKTGAVIKNKNGTYDIGLMGINSSWLPELKKHGVTQKDIQFDAFQCVSVTKKAVYYDTNKRFIPFTN